MFEKEKKLKLSELVDIKFLQEFQDIFAKTMNVASLTYDDTQPITTPSNFTEFCTKYTRGSIEGYKRCKECDIKWGQVAALKGEPVIYECHAGLTDFAVPIIVAEKHVGTIYGGQVLTKSINEEKFRKIAQQLSINEDEYIEALKKIKILSTEQIKAAADLLFFVANAISEIGHKKLKLIQKNIKDDLYRTITETIRSSLDIEETKKKIINIVGETLHPDRCFIVEYDKINDEFLVIDDEYLSSENIKGYKGIDINKTVPNFAALLKKGKPIIINNKEFCFDTNNKNFDIERTVVDNQTFMSALAFPLFYLDKLQGIIVIHYVDHPHFINEDEISLVSAIADQIATALYQAKLYKTTQIQAEREKTLRQIMSSSLDFFELDDVIKSIIDETGKLFKADRCFFNEFDSKTNLNRPIKASAEYLSSKNIRSHTTRQAAEEEIKTFTAPIEQKKIVAVENIEKIDLPEATKQFLIDDLSVKSYLILPVYYGNIKYGAIVLHYVNNFMRFTEEDIEVAKAIANQSAIVIHQAKLYAKTQMQAQREKMLREIVSEISSTLDLNKIRQMLVNTLGCALGSDLDVLYVRDPKTERFLPVDEYSLHLSSDEIKSPIGLNIIEDYDWEIHIRKNKKPEIAYSNIEDLKRDYNLYGTKAEEFLDNFKVKSMIAIPIIYANTFLGFLVMNFVKAPRIIREEDINLVKIIANQAAIALYQAKLYAQAHESAAVKGDFIANMSHELKTPLNIIIGFSDILSNAELDRNKEIEYLKNINKSGRHLLDLTNDIINISKIESGNFELNYTNVDTEELIVEVVKSIKLIAESKKINIGIETIDVNVKADKKMLTQILYNLLNNAIKFTPPKGDIIIKSEFNNAKLIISIEDTGIGIAHKNKNIIFEKFKQLNTANKPDQQGSGLGLSIIKRLIELHNGSIHVESEEGKGSRFWFVLPNAEMKSQIKA